MGQNEPCYSLRRHGRSRQPAVGASGSGQLRTSVIRSFALTWSPRHRSTQVGDSSDADHVGNPSPIALLAFGAGKREG